MKKILIISLFLVLILTACQKFENKEKINILLGGESIEVEVVVNVEDRVAGLSNQENLGDDRGMLFVESKKKKHNFWMKDMRFPLDIVYINDKEIVEIFKNVPIKTKGEYTSINPNQKANFILELNAGWCDLHNLKIGDQIEYQK
ncbi:DUF192 domain-containing protein [bacterium]|nr:DUF192 domain-containing protein [bacterium]